MGATDLIKKLRIQPGQRVLVLNAPEGYLDRLGALPEGATASQVAGERGLAVTVGARGVQDEDARCGHCATSWSSRCPRQA